MLTRNLTPFLLGYKLTARRPPRLEVAVIVRGRFSLRPGEPLAPLEGPLAQGSLSAEAFHEDDDERRGACLYPGDFADFKPGADLLLAGRCHPPARAATSALPVGFSVGAWSKFLEIERPRDGRPAPAPFGPVSPASPERRDKLGKAYGEAYRRTRAPYFAEDFDWAYFHAAPPDQRLAGYLRGNEEVSLLNLHPDAPLVDARLPGLRLRALVEDVRGRVEDVVLSLDTLFAEPEERRLTLTWRGHAEVREDDLADVRFLLVATEPLAEALRPSEPYRGELAKMARDPRGLEDLPPDMRAAYDLVRGEAPRAAPVEAADPMGALLAEKLGGLYAPEQARVREVVEKLRGLRAAEGVDLERSLADAMARLPVHKQAAFLPSAPGGTPRVTAGNALSALVDRLDTLRQAAAARGTKIEGLEKIDALLGHPQLREIVPGLRQPRQAPPPPGPGVDLSGQDLSGQDLSGQDLRGADLSGAIFANGNLARADLSGANLSRAVLFEADLSSAHLSGANLTQANLGGARAAGADLSGATLDQAIFTRADLTGATLTRARGKGALFQDARLARASAEGASFEDALFEGADLADARMRGARLQACLCTHAKAARLDLEGASIPRTSFSDADLAGATLLEAQGEGAVFLRARLDAADLRHASLRGAHLSHASARGARLACADLRESRLYRARSSRRISGRRTSSARICRRPGSTARRSSGPICTARRSRVRAARTPISRGRT
ncbi:DUF2169 domain-containing protein [Sorangium sp. So ce394]